LRVRLPSELQLDHPSIHTVIRKLCPLLPANAILATVVSVIFPEQLHHLLAEERFPIGRHFGPSMQSE
jgi:hypothetical protein